MIFLCEGFIWFYDWLFSFLIVFFINLFYVLFLVNLSVSVFICFKYLVVVLILKIHQQLILDLYASFISYDFEILCAYKYVLLMVLICVRNVEILFLHERWFLSLWKHLLLFYVCLNFYWYKIDCYNWYLFKHEINWCAFCFEFKKLMLSRRILWFVG